MTFKIEIFEMFLKYITFKGVLVVFIQKFFFLNNFFYYGQISLPFVTLHILTYHKTVVEWKICGGAY